MSQTSWACPLCGLPRSPSPGLTHRNDVILAEAQLIVIVALKVQQCLCSSSSVAGTGHIVLVVPLVALHAVVWSQILACMWMKSREQ